MVICIVIAGIISFLSIFAFFGNAYSNTGGQVIPNMFHLMFGTGQNYQGHTIYWKQFGGLTFLFVLQLLIMFVTMIAFFICYRINYDNGEERGGVIVSIILSIMSLLALILSFCLVEITKVNEGNIYSTVKLGFGPIFYSVLHIIVIVLLIIGMVKNKIDEDNAARYRMYKYKIQQEQKAAAASSTPSPSTVSKPAPAAKPSLSETEKVDLIMKYKQMLDENIITQEEFDKKKKELL